MSIALINQIFQICIVPLLGVLTTYFVKWVQIKTNEMTSKEENAKYEKYINLLSDTITSCVVATNQTYVEALKNKNAFDKEAQEEALKLTKNAVLNILSSDAQEYLNNALGDLNSYIEKKIEEEVVANKTSK